MNPQNLSKVITINQKLETLDMEIDCLETQYHDPQYKDKWITFNDNTSFFLSKDDLAVLLSARCSRRERLMGDLEKL